MNDDDTSRSDPVSGIIVIGLILVACAAWAFLAWAGLHVALTSP